MYNWYVSSRDLVYRDIADGVPVLRGVGEEEQVSAVERGFHRSTEEVRRGFFLIRYRQIGTKKIPQDDDDWRLGVCQESETFPDHEAGSHDRCKVKDL